MQIVNNFLEKEAVEKIVKIYEDAKGTASFEINEMGRWHNSLYDGNFGPVYVLRLDDWMPYFKYKFSQISAFSEFKLATCYIHIWTKGSGIRWHNDGNGNVMAATIYLNRTWDPNNGGLFLYEKDGENRWYCPQYNDCVWFRSPLSHSVSILSSNITEPRLSIQLFFTK